jgi:hypothetical protein
MSITKLDHDVHDRRAPGMAGAAATGRGRWWRFARHYLEMVVAMLAGMLAVGSAFRAVLGAAGLGYSHAEHPAIGSLEMTVTMSVGMVVWMRYRGHGWASTLEMTAAMFAPLVDRRPPDPARPFVTAAGLGRRPVPDPRDRDRERPAT